MKRKVEFIESYIKVGNDYQWNDNHGELIRCKDCARNPNSGKARTICPCPMDRYMGDEGFCSKAEPKEADG